MKVTFSRFMTFVVIVEMTALLPLCYFTVHYPPSVFMICWTGFWCLVEVMNIRLKRIRGKRDKSESLINEAIQMVKDSNISNKDVMDFISEVKEIIKE